jgi:sortase B
MKRGVLLGATVLLAGLLCWCAYRYYSEAILPEKQLDDANEQQLTLFSEIRPQTDAQDSGTSAQDAPLTEAEKVNPGVVGWVRIPGTVIDYPIAQGDDNAFYLSHGFDGQENGKLGCPFLDYRCQPDFSGFNSIVYAHHLKNHRMFADISLFADRAFMQNHPQGYLTLADGVHTVTFFAYLNVPSTAPAYHAVFVTEAEKQDYVSYIFSEAKYTQALGAEEIGTDARLLLLSTCTYEFDNARGILAGLISS